LKEPILDIGCGNGILLELYKDKTHIGIDASELAIELSKNKGLNVRKCKVNEFASCIKFKSVICIGLIGTIDDKNSLAKLVKNVLAKDGKFYISFPHRTIFHKEDEKIEHSFTIKEIKELLEKNGLRIERIIGLNKVKFVNICKNILVIGSRK
jgi:SAM-dependent methyltransferase